MSTSQAFSESTAPAASRAGADLQVLAYVETYGLNASITRGVRAYGPFQHPAAEPASSIVRALEEGSPIETSPGVWLHADDHSSAVELVLREGGPGEIYWVGEDDDAVRALGWEPRLSLDEGLAKTVEWYRAHRGWWERLSSGATPGSAQEQYARRDL